MFNDLAMMPVSTYLHSSFITEKVGGKRAQRGEKDGMRQQGGLGSTKGDGGRSSRGGEEETREARQKLSRGNEEEGVEGKREKQGGAKVKGMMEENAMTKEKSAEELRGLAIEEDTRDFENQAAKEERKGDDFEENVEMIDDKTFDGLISKDNLRGGASSENQALEKDPPPLNDHDEPLRSLCELWVDYETLTLSVPARFENKNCTLYQIVDPKRCLKQGNPEPSLDPPSVVILRAADRLMLAMDEYRYGVISAHAYGALHGYRVFLYVVGLLPKGIVPQWFRNTLPKKLGFEAVFRLLDAEDATESAVAFADLDGFMSYSRTKEHSYESVTERVRVGRGKSAPQISFLAQTEVDICSCSYMLWRTDFGKSFHENILKECLRPTPKGKMVCETFPYDQRGFQRHLLFTINGTYGVPVVSFDACLYSVSCFADVYPQIRFSKESYMPYKHVGFVPRYPRNTEGTSLRPYMHASHNGRESGLFYHTGHCGYSKSEHRISSEIALAVMVNNTGVCVVADNALQTLREAGARMGCKYPSRV